MGRLSAAQTLDKAVQADDDILSNPQWTEEGTIHTSEDESNDNERDQHNACPCHAALCAEQSRDELNALNKMLPGSRFSIVQVDESPHNQQPHQGGADKA